MGVPPMDVTTVWVVGSADQRLTPDAKRLDKRPRTAPRNPGTVNTKRGRVKPRKVKPIFEPGLNLDTPWNFEPALRCTF